MTSTPIQHYSAEDARVGFLHHALQFYRFPGQVLRSWDLVYNFFKRELQGRFRGSAGGMIWVVIQPIFQFCVYFMVFGVLFPNTKWDPTKGPDPVFAIYLFSGIVMFNAVHEGSATALRSVVQNSNLVKKVAFPCELLPLTPVLVAAVVYAVGCGVLTVVGLLTGYVQIDVRFLAWPVLVVCMITFATGLGLLLAGTNVFARDVGHLYQIFTQAWFFMSPIFWDITRIKGKAHDLGAPWALDIFLANPMFSMLLAQRQVFGIGHQLPYDQFRAIFPFTLTKCLVYSVIWAFAMFVIGYGFFMSRRHKFADLV